MLSAKARQEALDGPRWRLHDFEESPEGTYEQPTVRRQVGRRYARGGIRVKYPIFWCLRQLDARNNAVFEDRQERARVVQAEAQLLAEGMYRNRVRWSCRNAAILKDAEHLYWRC